MTSKNKIMQWVLSVIIVSLVSCKTPKEKVIIKWQTPDGGTWAVTDKQDTLQPERGGIDRVVDMGELGKSGHIEVYCIKFNKNNIRFPQGFVMIRLGVDRDIEKTKAYKCLSGWSESFFAENVDISPSSNWSAKEKTEWQSMKDSIPEVRAEFFEHIKFIVLHSEIESGVSQTARVIYE